MPCRSRNFHAQNLEDGQRQLFADALVRLARLATPGGWFGGLTLALNYALGHGSTQALAVVEETTVHPDVAIAVGLVKLDMKTKTIPTSASQISHGFWAYARQFRIELDVIDFINTW